MKLFTGGIILTMEPGLCCEAVLIDGEMIRDMGDKETLLKIAPDAEVIDLKGKTLMPAFLDAHSHWTQMASAQLQVSLEGADTVEEMAQRIRSGLDRQELPEGAWLLARDYDHTRLPQGSHPTLEQLDQMAPGHPLLIAQKSGHMGLANSAALSAFGLTPESPDPEGGRIGREQGKLTGYLEENAYFICQKMVPMPTPSQLLKGYHIAQMDYARHGIVLMQEGMVVRQMVPLYQMILQAGLPDLDLVIYPDPACYEEAVTLLDGRHPNLTIGGVKIVLDGSPQSRTAWMTKNYVNTDEKGYGTMTDAQVKEAMIFAADKGVQLLAHCNGDAAIDQFLNMLEEAERERPQLRELRPVIIHAQLMREDQVKRGAELGAIASFFAAHIRHWGDIHVENLGMERAGQISPAGWALRYGQMFTFHQDAPVIQPDMLETVACAVYRRSGHNGVLGPEQRISPWEALRAVTWNAAYQYGREQVMGSLKPGKRADLVILSDDPTREGCDIGEIRVEETWRMGKRIYKR